jgi:hypothetical protein
MGVAKSIYELFFGRTAWFMSDERAWILLFETATRMCEFTIGVSVHENEPTAYSVALVRVLFYVLNPLNRQTQRLKPLDIFLIPPNSSFGASKLRMNC